MEPVIAGAIMGIFGVVWFVFVCFMIRNLIQNMIKQQIFQHERFAHPEILHTLSNERIPPKPWFTPPPQKGKTITVNLDEVDIQNGAAYWKNKSGEKGE